MTNHFKWCSQPKNTEQFINFFSPFSFNSSTIWFTLFFIFFMSTTFFLSFNILSAILTIFYSFNVHIQFGSSTIFTKLIMHTLSSTTRSRFSRKNIFNNFPYIITVFFIIKLFTKSAFKLIGTFINTFLIFSTKNWCFAILYSNYSETHQLQTYWNLE